MNTTGLTTNPEENIEDYEDLAVKRSKAAKVAAIGGAGVVVGGAIAGATAYAAPNDGELDLDGPLTVDDLIDGGEVGPDAVTEPEPVQPPTTQYVYVEKPAPAPEPEPEPVPEPESRVVWEETNVYVVGDKVVGTTQEGTVDGHKFMIADLDGDNVADMIAIDANDNGMFESNEVQGLTREDGIFTVQDTPKVTEHIYSDPSGGYAQENVTFEEDNRYEDINRYEEDPRYAYDPNERPIHNNFEDEKTGERYYDDFAEDNPDYNPRADVDYGNSDRYLAEDYDYGRQEYHAGMEGETESYSEPSDNYMASMEEYGDSSDVYMDSNDEYLASADVNEPVETIDFGGDSTDDYSMDEPAVEMADMNMPEEDDSLDSMMSGEEFLG